MSLFIRLGDSRHRLLDLSVSQFPRRLFILRVIRASVPQPCRQAYFDPLVPDSLRVSEPFVLLSCLDDSMAFHLARIHSFPHSRCGWSFHT